VSSNQHFTCKRCQLFLFAALTVLRNQLTIKFGEGPVQPQDERLALARSWLEIAPGAQSIFSIWEKATEVLGSVSCFCLLCVEAF
jgi:hypothetical protein